MTTTKLIPGTVFSTPSLRPVYVLNLWTRRGTETTDPSEASCATVQTQSGSIMLVDVDYLLLGVK